MTLHTAVAGWLLGAPSGANTRLLALLRTIAPLLGDGERITVLHAPDHGPLLQHGRIAWHALPIAHRPSWRRIVGERAQLAKALAALGADVLDHGFLPVPEVPCPVVLTLHDLRDAVGQGGRPPAFARWLLRRSVARAHTVLVPSRFTAHELAAIAPHPRVLVAPNAVDVPTTPIAEAASVAPPELLHVGHLEPRKNLALLLRALALLAPAERPLLRLVGADAGSGRELRALAATLGIADRVAFVGVAPDPEVHRLLAAAHAFVLPSRYEGFGLGALEALAHGTPVLVSDAGALREVVGAHGIVLPVDDAAAWAAAIRAVPRQRSAAACEARRAHARTFAWSRTAAQVLAAWRAAARG